VAIEVYEPTSFKRRLILSSMKSSFQVRKYSIKATDRQDESETGTEVSRETVVLSSERTYDGHAILLSE